MSWRHPLVLVVATFIPSLMACDDDAVSPPDTPPNPAWQAMDSGTDNDLNALWAASASDAFAVGAGGTIVRFDGNSWQPMNSGVTVELSGVWGTAGDHVIATGDQGTILVFDGSDWTPVLGVTTDPIGRVSGLDANNVAAVGGGPPGTFLFFDGLDWTDRSTGDSRSLADAVVLPGSRVVLVGEGGAAFLASPDTVLAIVNGATANLSAVLGTTDQDVVAVGDDGTVLAFDLDAFEMRPLSGPSASLTGIGYRGYNDLFLTGDDGSIFTFDRCAARSSKPIGGKLNDVEAISTERLMATGADGTILTYSRPRPTTCPATVSVSISAGTTPTISWTPDCPVNLVLVEENASDMWLIWGDGNVFEPGVQYGSDHPCAVDFRYEGPLVAGTEYDVILFRYDGPDDYTTIAVKSFRP